MICKIFSQLLINIWSRGVRCCQTDLCNRLTPVVETQPSWPAYISGLLMVAIVATTGLIALLLYLCNHLVHQHC